jgi:hypothetical protein
MTEKLTIDSAAAMFKSALGRLSSMTAAHMTSLPFWSRYSSAQAFDSLFKKFLA